MILTSKYFEKISYLPIRLLGEQILSDLDEQSDDK
jgi:hypothetical protein